MSESIRVRLQFNKFSSAELRNCLLSINTTQTADVISLKRLIQKKHHLPENILLLIDGFVLDDDDTTDGLIRDNDIIVSVVGQYLPLSYVIAMLSITELSPKLRQKLK